MPRTQDSTVLLGRPMLECDILQARPSASDDELAREWIERINVEQPSVPALEELHRSLHGGSGTRASRTARLAWVPLFVSLHGVDFICMWLQRLLARGGGSHVTEAARFEGTEKLLLCLWQLMNTEHGMNAMLSSDGQSAFAFSEINDPLACNLFCMARCVDLNASSSELAAAAIRVQCTSIKLLTSAVAYSQAGHARVCAALRYVGGLRPAWLGLPLGKAGHRLFKRLVEPPSTEEAVYCAMVLVAALLDPALSPRAADRISLANEFGITQVVQLVRKRIRSEFSDVDQVGAIGQHVEVILEALWRDKAIKEENIADEDAAPPAAGFIGAAEPGATRQPRSKLRQELQRLRNLNSELLSQLEDLSAQSDAVKVQRDALMEQFLENTSSYGQTASSAPRQWTARLLGTASMSAMALENSVPLPNAPDRQQPPVAGSGAAYLARLPPSPSSGPVTAEGPPPVSAAEVDAAALALAKVIVGSVENARFPTHGEPSTSGAVPGKRPRSAMEKSSIVDPATLDPIEVAATAPTRKEEGGGLLGWWTSVLAKLNGEDEQEEQQEEQQRQENQQHLQHQQISKDDDDEEEEEEAFVDAEDSSDRWTPPTPVQIPVLVIPAVAQPPPTPQLPPQRTPPPTTTTTMTTTTTTTTTTAPPTAPQLSAARPPPPLPPLPSTCLQPPPIVAPPPPATGSALLPPPLVGGSGAPPPPPPPLPSTRLPPAPPPPPFPGSSAPKASGALPKGMMLRKLHLLDGKLGAGSISGTVWEALSAGCGGSIGAPDELHDEVVRLFAVAAKGAPAQAAAKRHQSLKSIEAAAAKVQLLDPKSSHLKAIGIHALAASLPDTTTASGSSTPRGDRAQVELAGTIRIVQALARGDPDAFSHDQLVMLTDLLPSDEDLRLVAAYEGSTEALGVVEAFTRACSTLPFARERAKAMLTRSAFSERVASLRESLRTILETVAAVQASAQGGVLRRILQDALKLYCLVNDDPATRGFRLVALTRFEGYMSADRRINLLQYLGRRLEGDELVADLSRLESRLSSVGRFVWSDVRHEVEEVQRTVDELRSLQSTIEEERASTTSAALATATPAALTGLASFVRSMESFCQGSAAAAIEQLSEQHRQADESTRTLLRYLAVDQKSWSRPEETLAALLEVVLAVKQAHRHHILARQRAAAFAEKPQQFASPRFKTDSGTETSEGRTGLVDGIAGRFAFQPGGSDLASNDSSAELLRMMLRRASVSGVSMVASARSSALGADDDGDGGDDDDDDDDDDE